MDDFALFSDRKGELWAWKRALIERLAGLRLAGLGHREGQHGRTADVRRREGRLREGRIVERNRRAADLRPRPGQRVAVEVVADRVLEGEGAVVPLHLVVAGIHLRPVVAGGVGGDDGFDIAVIDRERLAVAEVDGDRVTVWASTQAPFKTRTRVAKRLDLSEEKIRIVLEGYRRDNPIRDLCRREGIKPSTYYAWTKDFMEAGKERLTRDTDRLRQQKRQLERQLNGVREQLALAETERDRMEAEQGERARALQLLGQQLDRVRRDSKQRVRELAGKAYWNQFSDSPDFVVLFIPGEQFLAAALERRPQLQEAALHDKVVLATPPQKPSHVRLALTAGAMTCLPISFVQPYCSTSANCTSRTK